MFGRRTLAVALLFACGLAAQETRSHAGGFVHNENFVVYCPDLGTAQASNQLAARVLEFADECRTEIATKWLGKPLPPGIGRTVINVELAAGKDTALTWAKDDPGRRYHTIYLTTSVDKVVGSTLKHELAHAVLATRWQHPNRLPAWLEEGIASGYDNASRISTRRQIIGWCAETGNWPQLGRVLAAKTISAQSTQTYAVAASVTRFLLAQRDKETLFQFALDGARGWDAALRKHYNIQNVDQLQVQWQRWAARSSSGITVASQ